LLRSLDRGETIEKRGGFNTMSHFKKAKKKTVYKPRSKSGKRYYSRRRAGSRAA
jgi:hypothetical protein